MLMQAILIGIVTFVCYANPMVGSLNWLRPIVCGSLTGLVLGDPQTGCIIGATLELAFLGSYPIGGALPPDFTAGTILATAFVITSGASTDMALVLAFPISTLALLLKNAVYIGIRGYCSEKATKYAEQADVKNVRRMHLLAGLSFPVIMAVVLSACFYIGSEQVTLVVNMIPEFILNGLKVASKILPALGFAMLAKMLISKSTVHYFVFGFALAAYLNLPILGIAIFAVVLAVIIVNLMGKNTETGVEHDEDF